MFHKISTLTSNRFAPGFSFRAEDREKALSWLSGSRRWWLFLLVAAALALAIYGPVRAFEFINFDDDAYLENNPWLKRGFTWQSMEWAFVANLLQFSPHAEYWSPLTLLSRLADAQFFGVNAGAFHVTSACIHFLNALLLCAALFKLTGAWTRSAAVALLFLVHPLNVEPVCWLSARKDLLSATFAFATLLAYAHYAAKPARGRYALLLAAFCGALMAKPMAVTLPLLLMLLDWWPLKRWQTAKSSSARWALLLEKAPLLMLAVGAAVLAVQSQRDWGAIQSEADFPLVTRVNNALVSYVIYLRRIVWPSDLAIYYPHAGSALSIWWGAGAAIILVAATVVFLRMARKSPFILTGWIWFGVALGPVIGLVQIGGQAMADRYAYIPVIGIFVATVWTAADAAKKCRPIATAAGAIAIAMLALAAARQTLTWRNSETVFERDLAVAPSNYLAFLSLGNVRFMRGEYTQAATFYRKSIAMKPAQPSAWNNLGAVEDAQGNDLAAIEDYRRALQMDPNDRKSLLHLGSLLAKRGDVPAAEQLFRKAAEESGARREPSERLAALFEQQGRIPEAAGVWTSYLSTNPGDDLAKKELQRFARP